MRSGGLLFTAALAACAVFLQAGFRGDSCGAEAVLSFTAGVRNREPGDSPPVRVPGPVFRGPSGESLFLLESLPRGAWIHPPSVFRSEVRAVPFDGAVMLLFDHYSQPAPVKYRLYAGTSAGAGWCALEFEPAAVLEPHDLDYIHTGLTNFVEYYYIVTALDLRTGEYAVSDRIAFAVPGEGLGGYLDEKRGQLK